MDTIIERIARGGDDAPAILAPERRGADPWRPPPADGGDRRPAQRPRHRPRRPGGDRARQRAGDGDRLRLGRRGRDHRAAQPRLPRGRIRLLPLRHRRQGADRRQRRGRARGRRWPNGAASPSSASLPDTDGPAGRFTLEGAGDRRRGAAGPRRGRTTSPSSSTPRARPRGRSWCRSPTPTSPPPPPISARRSGSTPDDRCLNIMPLFHIHGLIAAVLASLAAGGSTFCTPGFNALRFFARLGEAKPSWYTAVPTMHQAILARAARNPEAVAAAKLRFIRSSSASLPPQVMAELEALFGCPVIESYGMTEAAHQMTSNPLPPARAEAGQRRHRRRPRGGDHGRGRRAARRRHGGRDRDPRAERDGRLREQPGGQRDRLRLRLVPHRRPGDDGRRGLSPRHRPAQGDHQPRRREDLAARGRRGADGPPGDRPGRHLRHAARQARRGGGGGGGAPRGADAPPRARSATFCATRLADFKVPRKIVILDEIPKGATGKLQRIGLAQKLGLG